MPRLGFDHEYLMHGILALSALHLATLQPDRQVEWTTKATSHETHALPAFRTAISNLSKESAHGIFAFSGLVIPYAQATASIPVGPRSPGQTDNDILPTWFYLIRGTGSLLLRTWLWLEDGPFAPLLQVPGYIVSFLS